MTYCCTLASATMRFLEDRKGESHLACSTEGCIMGSMHTQTSGWASSQSCQQGLSMTAQLGMLHAVSLFPSRRWLRQPGTIGVCDRCSCLTCCATVLKDNQLFTWRLTGCSMLIRGRMGLAQGDWSLCKQGGPIATPS